MSGEVDQREAQAQVLVSFIKQTLNMDRNANIMSAGDYNEFTVVQPLKTFSSISGLEDLDEAARTPEAEMYTYFFDMNTQALDHMFVSPRLATRLRSSI